MNMTVFECLYNNSVVTQIICSGGKRCVTPTGRKGKICAHAPSFACGKDEDCDRGRVCERHNRFREIR